MPGEPLMAPPTAPLASTGSGTDSRYSGGDLSSPATVLPGSGRIGDLTTGFNINALVLREAAADGAGVLLAPEFCVQGDLAEGRLVRLLPEWSALPLELSAAFPPPVSSRPRSEGLVAYLADYVATA